VAGGFLAVLFTLLGYLVQRSGARLPVDQAGIAPPAFTTSFADVGRFPVISYRQDGTAQAWNDIANRLFTGVPPNISSNEVGFRTVQATLLRASASPDSLEALRLLLDSCVQPAVVFDAEGRFLAANAAAERTLGWSDTSWGARNVATTFTAGQNALEIQNVLLMQGRWAVPASASAAAAQ
jgi:PAS domain-containing protein